jgi:hypothetical protein
MRQEEFDEEEGVTGRTRETTRERQLVQLHSSDTGAEIMINY